MEDKFDVLKFAKQDAEMNFERGIAEAIVWLVRQSPNMKPVDCAAELSRQLEAMRTACPPK